MSSLVDAVQSQLTPAVVQQMSRQLGSNEGEVQKAIGMALPTLVAALARNSQSPQGAEALTRALERDHDGSVLRNVPEVVANYQSGSGAGILRHVLGGQQGQVETAVRQGAGVDAGALLQMLAPVVLGALGQMQQQQHLDPSQVAGTLQRERTQLEGSRGDLMAVVGGLLDQNKDGSAIDDVISMASRFLGSRR
jgi:hypothetical protein